jgi:hypothetical protein
MSLLDKRIDQILKEFASYVRQYNAKMPAGTDYKSMVNFFRNNVVEIVFDRKTTPRTRTVGRMHNQRRMLCTANWDMIKAPVAARATFYNWQPPVNKKRGFAWYEQHNIIIVWDMMLLTWRTIPAEDIRIISFFPLGGTPQEVKDKQFLFVQFYRNTIKRMSETLKKEYGDRINVDTTISDIKSMFKGEGYLITPVARGMTAVPNAFSRTQKIKLQMMYPEVYDYDTNGDILYVNISKYDKSQLMVITVDMRRINHFTNSINKFKK